MKKKRKKSSPRVEEGTILLTMTHEDFSRMVADASGAEVAAWKAEAKRWREVAVKYWRRVLKHEGIQIPKAFDIGEVLLK